MVFGNFIASLAISLIFLPLLAWKWRIKMKIAIASAVVIGVLTGVIVSWLYYLLPELGLVTRLFVELFLIFLMVLLAIVIRFYRDPERTPLETENVILSPADGEVIYVSKVGDGSSLVSTKGRRRFRLDEITATDLLPDTAYLVGIDMNLLNVHVNRSPIKGEAMFQRRTRGKFISLRRQESEIVNERVTTIIGNGTFRVGVIQIASRLVRRIISFIKEGDSIDIGQRIGVIVFGSQVDLAIPGPKNLRIEIKPGDEVRAGISVVARYDS